MILKVARLGHPAIRTPAQAIDPAMIKSPEFQRLLDDMVDTMREYSGVGLAAPQVHLSIQVTVLEASTLDDWEGCLSIPEMRGIVPRYMQLRVVALGRQAEQLDFAAGDFHARVIQHETDHLKGEVYLDRMPNLRSLSHLAEWQRFVLEPAQ